MPETVCSISRNAGEDPRGLYHAITPEPIGNSLTGSRTAGTDTDRAGICWKRSEQPRTISAGTDTALSDRPRRNDSALCSPAPTDTDRSRNRPPEPCRPNQPKPLPPNRSSLSRSARAGFFTALRSGDCAAGSLLPYCHARKCFLRFFCADFCELRLMLISCNP